MPQTILVDGKPVTEGRYAIVADILLLISLMQKMQTRRLRPVLIISNTLMNETAPVIIVIPHLV